MIGAEHRAAIIAAGDVLKKAEVVPAGTDIAGDRRRADRPAIRRPL